MRAQAGWAVVLALVVTIPAACTPTPNRPASWAGSPSAPRIECSDLCVPSVTIAGPLFDLKAGGHPDASFLLSPNSIELRDLQGALIWKARVISEDAPRLVAAGDFNGDGVTDAIFRTLTTPANPNKCGTETIQSTQLAFIDGASGSVTYPVAPMADLCWNGFGVTQPYTTRQWGTGTAYIGALAPGDAAVVAAIPYYATQGWILRWSRSGWKTLSGPGGAPLVYPSTPDYDRIYDSVNPAPCAAVRPGQCYFDRSHVANAVFLDPAQARGLLVLTSARAFIYGSDLLPHSDLTWVSGGRTDNMGRNYGLLEHLPGDPGRFVLIGGCSVANARSSMMAGQPVNGLCSIHHHIEYFRLSGAKIVEHSSRYFGFTTTDGVWESRIEYLLNSPSGFGGTGAVVFNLYLDGQWRLVVMPDPARPQTVLEFPGWYAWDSLTAPDGRPLLLATRAPGGGGDRSKVLPWEFDVLQWRGQGPVSILHRDGIAPAIFPYPQSGFRHASDGLPYGVFTLPSKQGIRLLVTDDLGRLTSELIDVSPGA